MAWHLERDEQLAGVGLGANLGDSRAALDAAQRQMAGLPGTRLLACSSLYRSAPIEASGPDFLNAVVLLATSAPPEQLLSSLLAVEALHGRERPYHHAPRTLDLDLLFVGDQVGRSASLTLPHPRLHQRAFVLHPLLELLPDLALPGLGPLVDWLPTVADQSLSKLEP